MISDQTRELGEKIKEVIKKKNLSQKEVALTAGVSEEQVSRLMTGKNEPLFITIVKLAEALEIPMEALFNNDIETSAMIKNMMDSLPEDIVKRMAYKENGEYILSGFKAQDKGLTPEETEEAIDLFLIYKARN